MAWPETIQALEVKVERTLKGTYRPMDNVPFFRVQYPPDEEREALRQFRLLAQRIEQKGWHSSTVLLTEILASALSRLLDVPPSDLGTRLRGLEKENDRGELQGRLAEHLLDEVARALIERLGGMPKESLTVLLRLGALSPFIRSSSLESRLEGQVACVVILPYPGSTLGALLDSTPANPYGGYYRGELIAWQ